MMKLIISLLLITSVSFAQNQSNVPQQSTLIEEALKNQDPTLQDNEAKMHKVSDRSNCCDKNQTSDLLASGNFACDDLKEPEMCPKKSGGGSSKSQEGTN